MQAGAATDGRNGNRRWLMSDSPVAWLCVRWANFFAALSDPRGIERPC